MPFCEVKTVQSWEYKVDAVPFEGENAPSQAERSLNGWGAEGWELVSVAPGVGHNNSWSIVYLKRLVSN